MDRDEPLCPKPDHTHLSPFCRPSWRNEGCSGGIGRDGVIAFRYETARAVLELTGDIRSGQTLDPGVVGSNPTGPSTILYLNHLHLSP
jgi:hypothetical protein